MTMPISPGHVAQHLLPLPQSAVNLYTATKTQESRKSAVTQKEVALRAHATLVLRGRTAFRRNLADQIDNEGNPTPLTAQQARAMGVGPAVQQFHKVPHTGEGRGLLLVLVGIVGMSHLYYRRRGKERRKVDVKIITRKPTRRG